MVFAFFFHSAFWVLSLESKTQTSIQISTCLFCKIALFELNRFQFHSVVLTINTNYLVVTKGFPFNGEMAQQEEKNCHKIVIFRITTHQTFHFHHSRLHFDLYASANFCIGDWNVFLSLDHFYKWLHTRVTKWSTISGVVMS